MKRRICLGPEEYELQRSVTSATTLLSAWRSLVAEFDQTVLARKRREDPDNMAKWSLKFKDGLLQTKGQGPVADVSRVRLCSLDSPPPYVPTHDLSWAGPY